MIPIATPYADTLAAAIAHQAQLDLDAGDTEIAAYLVGRADALEGRELDQERADSDQVGEWYADGYHDELDGENLDVRTVRGCRTVLR